MAEETERLFDPPAVDAPELSPEEDYVFRFSLAECDPGEPVYDDPLLELIRGQLADLLDAVVLTFQGKRVRVDGFALMQEPDAIHAIFPGTAEGEAASRQQ